MVCLSYTGRAIYIHRWNLDGMLCTITQLTEEFGYKYLLVSKLAALTVTFAARGGGLVKGKFCKQQRLCLFASGRAGTTHHCGQSITLTGSGTCLGPYFRMMSPVFLWSRRPPVSPVTTVTLRPVSVTVVPEPVSADSIRG